MSYTTLHAVSLYFTAYDGVFGNELWSYHPSTCATLLTDINTGAGRLFPEQLTVFDDKLYLRLQGGGLWVYDPADPGSGVTPAAAVVPGIGVSFPHKLAVL